MGTNFNENLRSIRKRQGVTQEQLAEAVGVTPQAVSKWELSGYPDPAVLPQIADFLNTTIDELYGRAAEKEKDIYTRVLEHIENPKFSTAEKLQEAYEISRVSMVAMVGADEYQPVSESILNATDWESYTQMEYNGGFALARLNKNLQFALIMPQPEKGYDDVLHYDEDYTKLFSAFADKDVLRAVYYLDRTSAATLFTAKALSRELSVSVEKAEEIISRLLDINLIWKANLNDGGDECSSIYQYRIRGLYVVAFLTFARILLHTPYSFNYQNNSREDSYLIGQSYKRREDGEKKE